MQPPDPAKTAYQPLVVGYHGCRADVGRDVVNGRAFITPSTNTFDWLGHGAYFWEDEFARARSWARARYGQDAFVVGAFVNLGQCLNLSNQSSIAMLRYGYDKLANISASVGVSLPGNSAIGPDGLARKRELDCSVINTIHEIVAQNGDAPFDTIRAAFSEGEAVYPGASFQDQNHIQICVRNPKSILGFFLPLEELNYPNWFAE